MEPSTEVSAATQPVVKLSSQNNSSGETSPRTANGFSNPKNFRGTMNYMYMYLPPLPVRPSMKEGPISQWDSTITNPPHWSGDMYQEQLNRPTTHWCQPLPLSPPSPPPSSHYLSFTASCISRPGANGAKNYHSPSLQSHTTYLWNLQPITQVKSILQNLTPTCTPPAREHQLPHNQRINVAPT